MSTSLDSLQSHAVNPAQPSTRAPSAVRYTVTTASTSAIPTMAPVRAPEEYRLQILSPTGCSRADCDLFIGIDTNTGDDGFLDIYMEGTAAGWVAVGFSDSANMVSCMCPCHIAIIFAICIPDDRAKNYLRNDMLSVHTPRSMPELCDLETRSCKTAVLRKRPLKDG